MVIRYTELIITRALTLLTNLESFHLAGPEHHPLTIAVPWEAMTALQFCSVTSLVDFRTGLSGLARVPSLKHVCLSGLMPANIQTTAAIAVLAYELAAHRPDVGLTLVGYDCKEFTLPACSSLCKH